MRIVIETKKTSEMRYDTLGDWFYRPHHTATMGESALSVEQELVIQVDGDSVPDPSEQFLIALHELVEVKLCEIAGISQQQVDWFDKEVFPTLAMSVDDEPGDHSASPYRDQHRFAMLIEHLVAREMGLEGYGVVR